METDIFNPYPMHLLENRKRAEKWLASDEQFNQLYPFPIRVLAQRHWTPLLVARRASNFLAAEANSRVLDIGSGVGKFCLAAACHKSKSFFYGIEQREILISHAEAARHTLHAENVSFIHGNFTQLNFKDYDHFYFYNSFYENLHGTEKIDDSIEYSRELFNYYNRFLYKLLDQKQAGTRLATYHSLEDEVPPGYHIVGSEINNLLKFWIKI